MSSPVAVQRPTLGKSVRSFPKYTSLVDLGGKEDLCGALDMGKWLTDYDELRHTDWCFVVFETAQQLDEPERTLALAVFENEDAYRVAKAADFDDSSQMLLLQYIDEHAAQGSDKVFFKLRDGTTCYIAARNAREIDLELQRARKPYRVSPSRGNMLPTRPPVIPLSEYNYFDHDEVDRKFQLKAMISDLQKHADVEFTTEPEFNRIVIAGEQGAGKSTMLNYLIGTKAGFSASGTATRRPISYEVKHEADVNPVRYELENEDGSWTQLRNEGELMEKLAEGQAEVKKTAEFSDKPMKVRLTGAGLHTIKLIDLPGFVTTSYKDMVIKINQSHLKRADALIVVVVAAQRDWDTVEQVATEQVQLADPGLKRTIIVATRLNQSLSELSSTYLDAKTGSGAEMFPGVPKFFVDAMVEHSEHGDYKPVLFPVDPKEAQNCIDDASAVLKEKLTSRFGAELMTRLDMYIGAKALYHYLVSTIVGTAATIRSWNNKTAMQLRNFVEKETKRLGRLVLPNDQASRLSVLRHAANLYANAWQRTVTADFDVSPSKVKCTTTSFDEHELFARSSLCSRDLRECWPLNNVRSEASLKLREPIGAPALAVLRFREDEMPAVLCEVMKTIAVGYSEDREKELNLYRGVAKATRHEEPRTVMVKAARAYLKGNEGLSDSLKYISARIVHLMCFLSMEFTIEQLKTTDSATTGSLDGSALYDSGLMRKGQPIYNWLENEAIFDYATSDRLAPDLKVKFIMAQICEFGTQVEELESSPSEKGISLPQVRAVANKLIKTSLSRFGSCADFLVDTFVTEIIESFGAAIRDKANALRNEDVERIFGCFQDPNAEYAALLETIQKDLKQHRH